MVESLKSSASTLNLLVVPLAVQEMVITIWLIARVFSDSDAAPQWSIPDPLATTRSRKQARLHDVVRPDMADPGRSDHTPAERLEGGARRGVESTETDSDGRWPGRSRHSMTRRVSGRFMC